LPPDDRHVVIRREATRRDAPSEPARPNEQKGERMPKGKHPATPARLTVAIGLAVMATYTAATTATTGHPASVASVTNPPRCVVVRISQP
jgi:hypothetical protein